ncbi:hypothetical protein LCGC14_1718400 [marine sediment metagenome]|uniref:PrcB C-terminal n=2 Tax=root TaxID=1 RepID=A0A831QQ27_9FLAO|nr:hypothetical protein [Pricia antarctica]
MKKIAFVLSLFFATCTAQKTKVDSTKINVLQNNNPNLSFVAGDAYSGREEAETLIIRDRKSLQKFYSYINRTRKPGMTVPNIDFSNEVAIIRCSGVSEGETLPELYVRDIKSDSIILGVKDIDTKSSSDAITTPFALYKLPDTERVVAIKE